MAIKYTAITIGPIFDLMSLATKPAALWTASYLFSCLTKNLCKELVKQGLDEENIISPYFTKIEGTDKFDLINQNNGVGLFHDRIIFIDNGEVDIKSVKEKALKALFDDFGFNSYARDFLTEYILIADASFSLDDKCEQSPIFAAGEILDSLELSKTFVHSSEINPVLSVFEGKQGHGNKNIKDLPVVSCLSEWQLMSEKSKKLKNLSMIASNGKYDSDDANSKIPEMKKHRYYAIVRSDGDNMSSIISSVGNDASKIRDFSRICLEYCSEIAKIVYSEFGGVTIYSGGDDLLAILPCENENGKTVFNFVKRANEVFADKFKNPAVSLSFGIAVCYHKFPLYEALEESAHLLFDVAKSEEMGKNCAAINIHKHSGQSSGVVIRNGASLEEFLKMQDRVLQGVSSKQPEDKILLSVLHKFSLFEKEFTIAGSNEMMIRNLFDNVFDANDHKIEFITKHLLNFYLSISRGETEIIPLSKSDKLFDDQDEDNEDKTVEEQPEKMPESVKSVCFVLRMLKFLTERSGDN